VIAESNVEVLAILRQPLQDVLHQHPKVAGFLTEILGKRLMEDEGIKHVGDESFVMRAGELCFCPQYVYHGLENASETEPLVTIWGYCGAGSLEEAGYVLPEDG